MEGAPLLPKLRGYFAEFLREVSLARLSLFDSPTCVGLRYGRPGNDEGLFSADCPVIRFARRLVSVFQ